jgi:hypothetical protein
MMHGAQKHTFAYPMWIYVCVSFFLMCYTCLGFGATKTISKLVFDWFVGWLPVFGFDPGLCLIAP